MPDEQPSAEEIAKAIVKEQESAKQRQNLKGCLGAIVLVFGVATCVALLPEAPSTDPEPVAAAASEEPKSGSGDVEAPEAEVASEPEKPFGRSKTMLIDAPICTSEKELDQFLQAVRTADTNLLGHIERSGTCRMVPEGTSISVLEMSPWSGTARIVAYDDDGKSVEVWTMLDAVFISSTK